MKKSHSHLDQVSYELELQKTIEEIGIARFVGRVNSGVIPSDKGYAAVEKFVSHAKERPLLSRLSYFMLGRADKYARR